MEQNLKTSLKTQIPLQDNHQDKEDRKHLIILKTQHLQGRKNNNQ